MVSRDVDSLYEDISIISEPMTFIKNDKIVQLIRPRDYKSPAYNQDEFSLMFYDVLSNVDISCCGVSYDGVNLYENYPNAISHILAKCFAENVNAKMYNFKRRDDRRDKFIYRGWKDLTGSSIDIVRERKLIEVMYECGFDYIEEVSKYLNEPFQSRTLRNGFFF